MNGSNHNNNVGTTTNQSSAIMIPPRQVMSPNDGNNLGRSTQGAVSATATMTITGTDSNPPPQVLSLTLRPPPRVTWDETVQDNEGLGRKSSKRCCIFHKQRPFGESSTESSDDSDSSSDGGSTPTNNLKKIARPKSDKVPAFQRYHA